ncbi:MAG: DUF6544 family protein [Dokdonella sp.]
MRDPQANRARLPTAVHDLGMRLGALQDDTPSKVELTQVGRMKASLGSDRWLKFAASQLISTRTCEFDWQAKVGPFGLITGRDALLAGEGRFEIMALGIVPLARAKHTAALVRGELMRYLAEIAWAPQAIMSNAALRWRVDGSDTFTVCAGHGDTASEVILGLNSDGRIASAFAADRPRSATSPQLPTPWRGQFSEYQRHAGIWLPFAGEVAWLIDGKNTPYWQCRLTSWNSAIEGPDSCRTSAVGRVSLELTPNEHDGTLSPRESLFL